ncbi:MAG: protein CapI [Gammaproteobacteria bacterium]|nr:protein CapI [Gammaproteobacteria bacterium]
MKIIITGSAGFIGYHLCKSLLMDNYEIHGIDSINDYYDQNLKYKRLENLKSFDNFKFSKIDISNYESLNKIYHSYDPQKVVNLAAQAGVRYSLINPQAYLSSNLIGFFNIIELSRKYKVDGLIYASSSSVYGGNKKIPFSIDDTINNPISLYAATKSSNELIAKSYSYLHELHTTGLRYFTVYGPWGRPDMAMYKFVDKIFSNTEISVYNNGNMKRDFTYIDDIILGTRAAIEKNYKCEIFNLGNNKIEKLMDMISLIEKSIGKKAKINFLPMQKGDVKETFADINKSIKMLNYKPTTNIDKGINQFINWYLNYKQNS